MGGPVDLYVTGALMQSIRGRARTNRASVTAWAEVVGSFSQQKQYWHEVSGSGKGRIKRRFMYITKAEGRLIALTMLKASITGNP